MAKKSGFNINSLRAIHNTYTRLHLGKSKKWFVWQFASARKNKSFCLAENEPAFQRSVKCGPVFCSLAHTSKVLPSSVEAGLGPCFTNPDLFHLYNCITN